MEAFCNLHCLSCFSCYQMKSNRLSVHLVEDWSLSMSILWCRLILSLGTHWYSEDLLYTCGDDDCSVWSCPWFHRFVLFPLMMVFLLMPTWKRVTYPCSCFFYQTIFTLRKQSPSFSFCTSCSCFIWIRPRQLYLQLNFHKIHFTVIIGLRTFEQFGTHLAQVFMNSVWVSNK